MKILAIETSCDETAAAVVANGTTILSNVVASSSAMHKKYGGIVPEVAAREQLKSIIPVLTEALMQAKISYDHVDAIAVTVGPGLIGSLLVGVETAKTIAMITGKPIIPVNHVLAHMYANFVGGKNIQFPAISLVVSGGHTELYLMKSEKDITWLGGTIDDAAGEAFDKTARLLGFENGGGPAIEKAAQKNDALSFHLPRPLLHDSSFNFSFSGFKTAVMREWKRSDARDVRGFAYEVQDAITDVLTAKTLGAAKKYNAKTVLLSGGVAANAKLREKLPHAIAPPIHLCTDNAAYIASYAFFRGEPQPWKDITAIPDLSVENI